VPNSSALAPVTALSHLQRLQMRDLLDEQWRRHVVELTDLAVEYHALDDDIAPEERDAVAQRLAGVRRGLVEIEAALHRIQTRTYGRCDGCDRRMPFEQLELEPASRYCVTCRRPGC
jgi:RNA polymerase-binding transcription factor DksA